MLSFVILSERPQPYRGRESKDPYPVAGHRGPSIPLRLRLRSAQDDKSFAN